MRRMPRAVPPGSAEQLGDGNFLIDALDGLGKHGGHGQILDLVAESGIDGRNGVQEGQFADDAVVDALDGGAGQNTVRSAGMDALGL